MEACCFEECKIKYREFEKNFMEKVDEQRKLVSRQISVKGKKYNVIPYREERLGNRLKGKEIAEIEMKDGYCVYGYDEEGRIRLVEHACTSFEKFYNFECYDYVGEKVYAYSCSLLSSSYVSVNIFEGDKIQETYKIYKDNRWSYDNYIYSGDNLSSINVCIQDIHGEMREWHENFFYDEKKKLKIIQREEAGHRQNSFCDRKLNYKKIEKALEEQIKEACQKINLSDNSVKIASIETSLDSIEEIPRINSKFVFENREKHLKIQSHISENKIVLRDFPLDDFEIERVINSIFRVIVNLWEENVLEEDIYARVVKEGDILKEKLPGWLKNNSQIYFSEGKICCVKSKKKVTSKSIQEIYMDMKKAVNRKKDLQKQIEIFEEICKIPVDNDSDGEDLFIVSAETILFKEKLMFGFSLIRQIPCEDEFVQVGMDIVYELDDNNRTVAETYWSDEIEEDFFRFAKSTEIYELLCKQEIYDINIFIRET
ncbi:MAG: hypothetical protein LUG83_07525 [Lachnospiraceae bacterium]|nr:hypothetical protein [Lachnospiraceae bacterium]